MISGYYVHPTSKDCFIEVLCAWPGSVALVSWWNLGFDGAPWVLPYKPRTIKLGLDWKPFDPSQPLTHPGRQS